MVFQSRREGHTDLYRVRAEGSYPTRLTEDAGENQDAEWSPSGEHIAFQSDRSGTWQIWIMARDGSEQAAVTALPEGAQAPSFSPDGARIVFVSAVEGVSQVMQVTLSDGSVRQLTSSPGAKSQPALSPDGTLLAFVSDASGAEEIHLADGDGEMERQLTRFAETDPRRFVNGLGWTPQRELIFGANRDGHGRYFFSSDVFTLRADGTALRRIVSGDGNHNNPNMARNGSRIAFDAFRYGGADVFVVDADGSDLRNLTATSHNSFFPVPTPDGDRVVFQSERDGHREIYVMDRDGSDVRNLTHHPTDDRAPSMVADGSSIVFVSFRDSEWGDIYTMDADGGSVAKVTPDGFFQDLNQFPVSTAVTPDGRTVLFESVPIAVEGEAHWDIWRIDRDGENAARLTDSPGTSRSAAPSISPDGQSFLYHANGTGDYEVYRMPIDGGSPQRLTEHDGLDYYPTWSRDGRSIYFTSTRAGQAEIFRMSRDGSDVEQVTRGDPGATHLHPRIDASSRNLWVVSNRQGETAIHRLDLDGSNEVALTAPWGPTTADPALSAACSDFTRLGQPHWSWAGNRIAFPGDCGGQSGLHVYDVDADALQTLDLGLESPDSPAWSTRGDRIAFNAEDTAGNRDLYIYDTASGATTRVTTGGVHGGWVTWSPDDLWLNGYGPDESTRWNVFRVPVDGGAPVRINERTDVDHYNLTESPSGGTYLYSAGARIWSKTGASGPRAMTPARLAAFMPHWAPDGRRFVFDGNGGLGWDLWIGRSDGGEPIRLTRRAARDSNGTWSPDGSRIVYICQLDGDVPSLCLLDVDTRRALPLFRPRGS